MEGQEIKAVPSAPRRTGQVVDIFAALKKSLETAGQQKATAERGKRKGRVGTGKAKLQGQVFTFDIEPTQRQAFQG